MKENTIYGFVYLFLSAENNGKYLLRQDANDVRIHYTFNLTSTNEQGSNDYLDVYNLDCPNDETERKVISCYEKDLNPEDTWFSSHTYQRHFSENW